jgi:hypothetical protein
MTTMTMSKSPSSENLASMAQEDPTQESM